MRLVGCQTREHLIATWQAELTAGDRRVGGPRRASSGQAGAPLGGGGAGRAVRLIRVGAGASRWSPTAPTIGEHLIYRGSSGSGDAPLSSSVRLLAAGPLPAHRS